MLTTFGPFDEMRATPTANYFGSGTDGGNFNVYVHNTATVSTAPLAYSSDGKQIFFNFSGNNSYPNSGYWIDFGNSTNQFALTLSAEL
jgi:hypothetical protein